MSPAVQPLIGIIDYGMGNRRSVEKAIIHIGARAELTADTEILAGASALVLPGVGAFPRGVDSLRRLGLETLIHDRVQAGVPLLGICLGMQLLFDSSSELGEVQGLGLIRGRVEPLRAESLRVPHIGWNEVRFERASRLTAGLPATGAPFYHVHSFVARPDFEQDVVGTVEYGERFTSIVAHENVYGVQFHPEKSSTDGLTLLRAFVALAGITPSQTAQRLGASR